MQRNGLCVFVLLFFVNTLAPACAQDYLQESQTQQLFGTIVAIDICFVDGRQDGVKAVFDQVWKRLEEIQIRTDAGSSRSDVSVINASGGGAVKVQEDVYRLIDSAREMMLKSGGTFDITVAPLAGLWLRAARQGAYPALSEIAEAKKHVGMDHLELNSNGSVRLTDPSSRIDLGSIASSFAVDEAVRLLRRARFFNFMINAGGSIYAAGTNCRNKPWRIVLKDPDRHGKMMDVIELGDAAVSTTGDNEQPLVIQGKRWSRIMNPMTGYPQNGVADATVIAPTAVEARALALAMCVLGPDQGLRLVKEMGEGYSALLIFRREGGKYEWFSTPGYEDLRVNQAK